MSVKRHILTFSITLFFLLNASWYEKIRLHAPAVLCTNGDAVLRKTCCSDN